MTPSPWRAFFSELLEQIKLHRAARGVSLTEAKDVVYGNGALERYFQLTGFRESERSLAPQA
jgi:hypothetical protein